MKYVVMQLLVCGLLLTPAYRQQADPAHGGKPEKNPQATMEEALIEEPAMEPVTTPVDPPPFPGLPVYVETEEYRTRQQAILDAQGEYPPPSSGRDSAFDHFDDPPADGVIRLVYVYNYGDTQSVLVKDRDEVNKIMEGIHAFRPSDYASGPLMGGYAVQIQVVQDGVHQSYSVTSGEYSGGYIATNNREAESWYFVDSAYLALLMDYFGGVPQYRQVNAG